MPSTAETHKTSAPSSAPRRRGTRYSQEEVDRSLTVLIFCDGNSGRASRLLAAEGLRVPPRTLREWGTKTYADRLILIRTELTPYIKAAREERYRKFSRRFAGVDPNPEEAD